MIITKSFRVDTGLVKKIQEKSRELGVTQNELLSLAIKKIDDEDKAKVNAYRELVSV